MRLPFIAILCMFIVLLTNNHAMEYKWYSTIPIEYVPLSTIDNEKQLNRYLNNDNIVVFYIDRDYNPKRDDWVLYKFNITRVVPKEIPNYYNYTYINTGNSIVIYPKNSLYRDDNGVIIYNPPVPVNNSNNGTFIPPVYNTSTKLLDPKKGIYEIKPKKLLITNHINPDDKDILDFVGYYVSENNGTFAYINKVPPGYKSTIVTGIVVQKVIFDKDGKYVVDIAGRKLKVDLRDDDLIDKKLKHIEALSKLLNVNVTYISTGSENLNIIEKKDIDKDELDSLLNNYWFKKWSKDEYFHIYVSSVENKNHYPKDFDILSLGYYPEIYTFKAPETFKNHPIGGYYPETISYEGTNDTGYWEKGLSSENEFYYYERGEPEVGDNNEYVTNWYYGEKPLPLTLDSEINSDKYKYFNSWFVRSYSYAVSNGADGLLVPNDRYLLDAVLGKDNKNLTWKLDIVGKIKYVVSPGYTNISNGNGIPILRVPGLIDNESYGVPFISECYIPPKDENFGVYVADIVKYDTNKIYSWKDNYTWVCSFKNYVDWANNYINSNITIKNNSVIVYSKRPLKVTLYRKNISYPDKNMKNISLEEFNREYNKMVFYTNSGNFILNI